MRSRTILWITLYGLLVGNASGSLPATAKAGVTINPPPMLYFHGSGSIANPPILFLDGAAPSGSTASYSDSASVKFAGGNPWKDMGVWAASPSILSGSLIGLREARVWLGLKNSDDQGTRFDLRVELYKAGQFISAGETYCIQGVTRNPSLAKEVVVPLQLSTPVTFDGSTEDLSLRVQTRIGTNGAGVFCGGHSNAVGLRLYFDSGDRPSLLSLTFEPAEDFVPTGSMSIDRCHHAATLLGNGKVLVTGGLSGSPDARGVLTSAELYDPSTGTFTATGNMTTGRYQHMATLLNNGLVLIAGGQNDSGYLASAELYDPATGTFTATGNMTSPRVVHTATLLNNGKVLIAGGDPGLASAELYDPATGTFTDTGSMTSPRANNRSTLLSNGQVLIASGYVGSYYYNLINAELYDPATGMFTATGNLTSPRHLYTATLLNNGWVLIAGGFDGSEALSSVELYDPAMETFSTAGIMTGPCYSHTATLLNDGKVLIAGGWGYWYGPHMASADLYDPETGTFTATGSMTHGRAWHTATRLSNGQVLLVGGWDASDYFLASAELYTPTGH